MKRFLRAAVLLVLGVAAPTACSSGDKAEKSDLVTGQVHQAAITCTMMPIDPVCDDSNVCTVDTCVAGVCQNVGVKDCCNADGDCNDNVFCTTDTCDTANFACVYTKQANCCTANTECDDANACTTDVCNT